MFAYRCFPQYLRRARLSPFELALQKKLSLFFGLIRNLSAVRLSGIMT